MGYGTGVSGSSNERTYVGKELLEANEEAGARSWS